MSTRQTFFDFSPSQIKVIIGLCSLTLILSLWLMIRAWSTPPAEPVRLPVIMGDPDQSVTGLFLLDPNTAPADSLELLPGIGRVLADRIVAYRQQVRFEREVDITDVNGIGPKMFERMRPYLKVKRP